MPVGDDDMYEWQCEKISEIKLYEIVSKKMALHEQIGVNLFYGNGSEGISLLADTTKARSIDRKTYKGNNTDMVWYLENIIYKLIDIGVRISSYKLQEYDD